MSEARRPVAEDIPGIIDAIADGKSMRAACMDRGIHVGHTHAYLRADDRLWANYLRARAIRGDDHGERVAEVVDKMERKVIAPDVGRAMIDGLKWTAGRMAPKLWGDKTQHEHSGPDGGPIQHVDLTGATDDELDQLEALQRRIAARSGGAPLPDAPEA